MCGDTGVAKGGGTRVTMPPSPPPPVIGEFKQKNRNDQNHNVEPTPTHDIQCDKMSFNT